MSQKLPPLVDGASFQQARQVGQEFRGDRPNLIRRGQIGDRDRQAIEFRFHFGPLGGQPLGFVVQAQRPGRRGIHIEQVGPHLGELGFEVGQNQAQAFNGPVGTLGESAEFRFDQFGQAPIGREGSQFAFDMTEDEPLDMVGGDRVPLRASVGVSVVAGAAGVRPRPDPLAAGPRGAGHPSAADAAGEETRQQVVRSRCPSGGVTLAVLDIRSATPDRFKDFEIDQGLPRILDDHPIVLGPLLDTLIRSLDAAPVGVAMPLALGSAVVDASSDIGRVLEDRDQRLRREHAAARGPESLSVQPVADRPRADALGEVGEDPPHCRRASILRGNKRAGLVILLLEPSALVQFFEDLAVVRIEDGLGAVVLISDDPSRGLAVEDQAIEAERDRATGPESALGSCQRSSHGVAGEFAEVVAVLVMLDEADETRSEGVIGFLARRGVDDPLARFTELAFEQHAVDRILRTREPVAIPGHHNLHILA